MKHAFLALTFLAVALGGGQIFQPSVPSGSILYFNATSCPSGWSEFTSARGDVIVGNPSGGTLNSQVGSAFTNLENRTHTHSLSVSGTVSVSGTSAAQPLTTGNGSSVLGFDSGSVNLFWAKDGTTWQQQIPSASSGTPSTPSVGVAAEAISSSGSNTLTGTSGTASGVIPYIQLLVCQKS